MITLQRQPRFRRVTYLPACFGYQLLPPGGTNMDLDYRQMRRLYLAGTVALPVPFPTVGTISIEEGKLANSPHGKIETKLLVLVREELAPEHARTHVILAEWVAAIFYFTGEDNRVDDFEKGEWALGPPINADKIPGKVKAGVARRNSD